MLFAVTTPRTILLSGACGSGKTSIAQLGYRRLSASWGRTATLDTDTLFMMVDPHWELPFEERRGTLVVRQVGLLASSFLDDGFETMLVLGNALHSSEELDLFLPSLLERGDVFHVTLDPSLEEVVRRVAARGGDKTADWLATHVAWMRERYESWTCRIDNTSLSPSETVDLITAQIALGCGRLTRTFGAR
jgi:adenylylsulfate kinase-like enzyme